ncbi:MAG TPA: hypothetical protein VJ788_07260 [Gemmatimonadota bacterium]|nr:hypothetical protein [Gemmatimonadota bacterium]
MRRVPLRSFPVMVLAATWGVLLAAACGGPDRNAETGDTASARDSAAAPEAAATAPAPADSVIAWVNEIRDGIRPLPGRVGADPEGARQRAVELYVTRQERIEQAAGPGTGSPGNLAESVHEAEARFHELMQLLGETPPPDSAAVESAVEALDARLAEVVELLEPGGTSTGNP